MENNGVYIEQMVTMRKKVWMIFAVIGAWLAAVLSIVFALFSVMGRSFGIISCAAAIGVCYMAFKITTMMSIEYEYTLTDGEIDIDRIVSKSTRTRVVTFKCDKISRIEKYNPNAKYPSKDKIHYFCNPQDKNTFIIFAKHEKLGDITLAVSLNEKMQQNISKFVPKYMVKDVFCEGLHVTKDTEN